jgi:hypothetical protein
MARILHFCKMLSRVRDYELPARLRLIVPLDQPGRRNSLADMPDSDPPQDMEEYLSRLGVVLQIARKEWADISQVDAAKAMGMSAAAFTRWEQGRNKISAYDLARLVRLYDFDPDLAINPPSSKVEIRRRLGIVGGAARGAVRRALQRPLEPPAGDEQP